MRNISNALLAIPFLLVFLGCKIKKTTTATSANYSTKENFVVIQAKMANGKPIFGIANKSYKNYQYKTKYPWCLEITIAYNLDSCFINGLPLNSESKIANKLEDDLLFGIKNKANTHYIGHTCGDTFQDVYIYLDDPKLVHEFLQNQIDKPGLTRGFRYEIKEDKDWETVKNLLQ